MSKAKDDGYNGPGKERFLDVLADYEEERFFIMRHTSRAGKILRSWEQIGGEKDDIKDGYALRQMDKDDQVRELRRQVRVASWVGVIDEDRAGQASFLRVFDAKPAKEQELGIGGAPIGSRLSIVRARAAGFGDGKLRGGPTLGEGQELYTWSFDSEEAMAYAEGFGDGLLLRPPPKVKKGEEVEDEQPVEEAPVQEAPPPVAQKQIGGGTRRQVANQALKDEVAAEIAAAEQQGAGEASADADGEVGSGWGGGFIPRVVN